jgi:PPOX class probable F420-dependent enzyme
VDADEMRRRAGEARVARMATVDSEGRPHVVPLVFAIDGDILYSSVDEKPKASRDLRRIRNLRANPVAEVVVDHYEEDWERIWWVRLRGRADVLEDGPERERGLDLLARKYPQYVDLPPQGAVIAVRIDRWRGWSYRPIQ